VFVDGLVIGGSLQAYLYAISKGLYIIDNTNSAPKALPHDQVFQSRLLPQLEFFQSMLGKSLLAGRPDSLKVYADRCKIVKGRSTKEVAFSQCYIFDTTAVKCYDNDLAPQNGKVKVTDYFKFKNMKKNINFNTLSTLDSFVSEVQFVKSSSSSVDSPHIGGCLAISHLMESDLEKFDFSDTMVRFKLLDLLRKKGFKGKRSGVYKDGSTKYASMKLFHIDRSVEQYSCLYKDSDTVKFLGLSTEKALD